MLFFGLLWVTSWIGYFFSSIQSLPPSFLSRTFPTKVSTNVDRPLDEAYPFLNAARTSSIWNTSLLPAPLLKLDWRRGSGSATEAKPHNSSITEWNPANNLLCRPDEEQLRQADANASLHPQRAPHTVATGELPYSFGANAPSWSQSPALAESPPSLDFLPNKILRSLQNIFRWPRSVDESFNSRALPVVIARHDPEVFELWVKGKLIATLPNKLQANLMQQRLAQILQNPRLDASQLRSATVNAMPAVVLGNRILFVIDKEIATQLNRSRDLLAIEWSNNLRVALGKPPLTLLEAQTQMYGLVPTTEKFSGLASWYGPSFDGLLTATGEIFNQNELTAAHPSLPFNTYLKVTNMRSGNGVIVRVNDRGPYIEPRTLDLSREAARCINSETAGVVPYEAIIMQQLATHNHNPPTQLAGL